MDSDALEKVKNLFASKNGAKKDHVDPFVVFSFAGSKAESLTKEQNASPVWNEELRLDMQFPPLSEKISLQVSRCDGSFNMYESMKWFI